MLCHQQDLAPRIGRFALLNIWHDYSKIVETINEFYGEPVAEGFYPHFNEVALRQAILSASPNLNTLQQQIKELMDLKYSALLIEPLNIQSVSNNDNKLLYALSLSLGYPTPTEPRQGRLLWDVKPRFLPVGHFATYSEHHYRAELHTDTQYYTDPEELFLLYVVRAARCGGGRSLLCSAHEIKECLLKTAQGREAFEILSNFKFPFRIPTTFTQAGTVKTINTTLAPVFSDKPFIRFRYDTLEKGFQARPDLDVPEARFALKVFLDILETVAVVDYQMPDDSLLICNNHTMLHGRTSFEDRERHLLRVRLSSQPVVSQLVSRLALLASA